METIVSYQLVQTEVPESGSSALWETGNEVSPSCNLYLHDVTGVQTVDVDVLHLPLESCRWRNSPGLQYF